MSVSSCEVSAVLPLVWETSSVLPSIFFSFTLFAAFMILSFPLNFQFLSLQGKGAGLLFVLLFSLFSVWSL